MSRSGLAGPPGAITTGMAFGVPPLLHYASKELQERFLPDLLLGRKRTCIAITEPEYAALRSKPWAIDELADKGTGLAPTSPISPPRPS
jgi:alkylation response protein AidB-like acyl-CoA dehydrogenase